MKQEVGVKQLRLIDELVKHFTDNSILFNRAMEGIESCVNNSNLKPLIHSYKYRIKDPEHLREKLIRKARIAKKAGKAFNISRKNLFSEINDLVGFRIIHLHTKQIEQIDRELQKIFTEQKWVLVEGPIARTWDLESNSYYKAIGIGTNDSPTMYTSVHYVIQPNSSASITCEIQVRTLMEEVWGEVNHAINYPKESESLSCREQIKALARLTSSCSRLVDSVFSTYADHLNTKSKNSRKSDKTRSIKPKPSHTVKRKPHTKTRKRSN